MRIIAGEFRRRQLEGPPKGSITRPLPDAVREALFNLLRGHFEGVEVLDLFAGTGSFGLEAISRGAARAVMIERDKRVADVLRRNAERVGASDRADVVVSDALGPAALTRCPRPAHIIFLDPPYDLVRDPQGWARVRAQAERLMKMLTPTGYLVLRTPWAFTHEASPETGEAVASEDARRRRRAARVASFEAAMDTDGEEDPTPEAGRVLVDVSLRLQGALGPETHDYRNTALHLYMRDDAATGGGGDDVDSARG